MRSELRMHPPIYTPANHAGQRQSVGFASITTTRYIVYVVLCALHKREPVGTCARIVLCKFYVPTFVEPHVRFVHLQPAEMSALPLALWPKRWGVP